MFRYKIGNRDVEFEEALGAVKSEVKFALGEHLVDILSCYRSPNEADANVAGEQKANLYTKLGVFERNLISNTTVRNLIANSSINHGGFIPSSTKAYDRELAYYAIYIKKDLPPGCIIKICQSKDFRKLKSFFFKVKNSPNSK